jgi:transcriptional regulator with XRE-family HTH domain
VHAHPAASANSDTIEIINGIFVLVDYLSKIERVNATPTLGNLTQIAQALEAGTAYFARAPRC